MLREAAALQAETVDGNRRRLEEAAERTTRLAEAANRQVLMISGRIDEIGKQIRDQQRDVQRLASDLETARNTVNEAATDDRYAAELVARSREAAYAEANAQLDTFQSRIGQLRRDSASYSLQHADYTRDATLNAGVLGDIINGIIPAARERLTTEASVLTGQIGAIRTEASGLERKATEEEHRVSRWWLPAWTKADAESFYGQPQGELNGGRTGHVRFGNELGAGSATVELLSFLYGPVRLNLSGVIASDRDTTTAGADSILISDLERFFAGGGTLVLGATFPLIGGRYRTAGGALQLLGKAGFDTPGGGVGSVVDDPPANLDTGLEGYFALGNEIFQAFVFARGGYVVGNNAFGTRMGDQSFRYVQALGGVEIYRIVRILVSTAVGGAELGQRSRLTIQFTSGQPR